ncbi:class II aldolase/adducin family protein [Paenibacillus sp. GD4]|uniref:class II aldolase/adducin family protein n=1 Tax=Paenibacillus sp. GD4 TaxID=3068890 RepID=UPI002796BC82|nr:class II aldolase/adducin family protein [Paenibacillus sp. GD4]MDQ1911643.1 class II aldolase/adducin family protein [Paenibacillus sp. GD4]
MSKYAGERFDLIQAGGGNTSVKLNSEEMLIKASGFLLSDVEEDRGYVLVNNKKILKLFSNEELLEIDDKKQREKYAAFALKDSIHSDYNIRPSIETFLHSLLYKYTLHTHPIVVNIITCQKQWKESLENIFSEDKPLYISYQTPGIDLALEMNKELQKYISLHGVKPKLIFLQNHGLIVSSDEYTEIEILNERVTSTLEKYLKFDSSQYKLANAISRLVNSLNGTSNIAYLSEDLQLAKLISDDTLMALTPFCPDGFVFCGVKPVVIKNLQDKESIQIYYDQYFDLPKIIVYNQRLFIVAANVRKAKEIEDVFKFQLMSFSHNDIENINLLTTDELNYLGNWDAEKYRQKL